MTSVSNDVPARTDRRTPASSLGEQAADTVVTQSLGDPLDGEVRRDTQHSDRDQCGDEAPGRPVTTPHPGPHSERRSPRSDRRDHRHGAEQDEREDGELLERFTQEERAEIHP